MKNSQSTSWQKVSGQYTKTVGLSGHYYHQHVILPSSLRLLNLNKDSSLLDLACGQGVLGRQINSQTEYYGLDASPALVKFAKKNDPSPKHQYLLADIQKALPLKKTDFSHAVIILALQNLAQPDLVIKNATAHLRPGGQLLLVLNHPAFRIPRQSSWGIDPQNKLQYRRLNHYFSPLKIPINMTPGEKRGSFTWSFHFPLQSYFKFLRQTGLVVLDLEEWLSDKESVGRAAKTENRGRSEFPLFLAILAQKPKTV